MWKCVALILIPLVYAILDFKGDVVLKITPKTDEEVAYLKNLIEKGTFKFDVWKGPSHRFSDVDIHVSANDVEKVKRILQKKGILFSVMIKDLAEAIINEALSIQKNAFSSGFNYEIFNRYNDIVMELKTLAANYPYRARTFSVGYTYENREMIGIQITNGNLPGLKPVIWIDGGIHAREWISPATVMWIARHLLTDKSPETQNALSKYDFYVLPVFNADGYEYTFSSMRARTWRKTRSVDNKTTCVGVDPNRNWSYKFGGDGTSSFPCSEIYSGRRAFSEIEVSNVARYLENIPNLKSYWNFHAYGQLILTPWSYTSQYKPRHYQEMIRVANFFLKTADAKYQAGPPSDFLYNAAGGSIDWTYGKLGVIYSYAPELRDKGLYGFLFPTYLIKKSGTETSQAFIASVNAMV